MANPKINHFYYYLFSKDYAALGAATPLAIV